MPASASGRVERTVPSVRRQSGAVKTSSVGRFATWKMPSTVSPPPPIQRAPGQEADRQVGAGPVEVDRVEGVLVQLAWQRAMSFSLCARQAATGSGSSSRTAV